MFTIISLAKARTSDPGRWSQLRIETLATALNAGQ